MKFDCSWLLLVVAATSLSWFRLNIPSTRYAWKCAALANVPKMQYVLSKRSNSWYSYKNKHYVLQT